MRRARATIGVTMGDPAGIGPEIVVKALSKPALYEVCRPVVFGDLKLLKHTADQLKEAVKLQAIKDPEEASGKPGIIEVVDLQNVDLEKLKIGTVSREAGKASVEYIEAAVKYALAGKLDALATAPINKESINLAGSPYIGHTELISALTNSAEPETVFWVHGVAILFLTRHLSLKKAIEAVKKDNIVASTIRINGLLQKLGLAKPRIAVAALNPHGSDGGLMGDEEEKEIAPAVKEIRERGVNASGPIPADSVFHLAFSGAYDAVLSLYHDQGHIPAKTVDFYGTVSLTLNLPFVRTSVDHGTAFEIAGKGIANSKSMEEAIRAAAEIVSKFRGSYAVPSSS